jgi:hypothetical protein
MPLRVLLLCDDRPTHAGTVLSHIEALTKKTAHRVSTLNPRGWSGRRMIDLEAFDVVIVHYSISIIFDTYLPPSVRDAVCKFAGLKVIFIQDEYRDGDRYVSAMIKLGFDLVYSSVPGPRIQDLYGQLLRRNVRVVQTLTGFVPEDLRKFAIKPLGTRPIHVVYRGRPCPYELGDLAQEKVWIAVRFNELAAQYGLVTDIDWRESSRIYGEDWPKFMSSGRAALGTESGASIVDFDGNISCQVASYCAQHPSARYEEVADALLAKHEGNLVINTISPRAFEAIALRTALVLFPGDYSGILLPERHYVPLLKDFSNFADVAKLLKDPEYLERMAGRAYDDIVASGLYSYGVFAQQVDAILVEEWTKRVLPRKADQQPGPKGWRRGLARLRWAVNGAIANIK